METINKMKRQPTEWEKRRYLQMMYLTRGYYPKYIRTHTTQPQKNKQPDYVWA